jgi:hypothetical protein
MAISHLQEYPWQVGQRREKTISQSFSFIIELPRLKIEDLDYLLKERGIDSWILRVRLEKGSILQDLGYLNVPFDTYKLTRGVHQRMPGSVSFIVQYAAVFTSERFRSFKCPAFRHNKKISSLNIEGKNDEFSLLLGQSSPFKEKIDAVEIRPKSLNGGISLVGDYFIEIAPFNYTKKVTLGSFKRIPMFIRVESEDEVSVPSCAGIRSEND